MFKIVTVPMVKTRVSVEGVTTIHPLNPTVFSAEALIFLRDLVREFRGEWSMLMDERQAQKAITAERLKQGLLPFEFIPPSKYLRPGDDDHWQGPKIPEDLQNRRVEITGPASSRRMVVNSMRSEASTYMTDFEDSMAPTIHTIETGHVNLYLLSRGELTKQQGDVPVNPSDKPYFVRPRGLHLLQPEILVDGQPIPGAFIDFAIDFFNNAKQKIAYGSGPYYYIPKLESHKEAALWAKIFASAESKLNIPKGTIRVTALIETFPAAFQMDAIAYQLRDYICGLNCGRWDYLFSYMKTIFADPQYMLPDRVKVTMGVPFMTAYAKQLIDTCHRHGIHAMGGMSSQVPFKAESGASKEEVDRIRELNAKAMEAIATDKRREAELGHDGAWVAHPDLAPSMQKIFKTAFREEPHQLGKVTGYRVTEADLTQVPRDLQTPPTELGVRTNISIILQYMTAWLHGSGTIGTSYMAVGSTQQGQRFMEDMATAEIARMQLYQWLYHDVSIQDQSGQQVKIRDIFESLLESEIAEFKVNKYIVKYSDGELAKPSIFDKIVIPAFRCLCDTSRPPVDFIPDVLGHSATPSLPPIHHKLQSKL